METPVEQNVPKVEPVRVCRVCFAIGGKLYAMTDHKMLYNAYEAITGLVLANDLGLPPYLCYDCAQRLMKCARFRSRTLQGANIHAQKMSQLEQKEQE